ncbi:MAG: hypothetical protein V1824_01775 [archaeon]
MILFKKPQRPLGHVPLKPITFINHQTGEVRKKFTFKKNSDVQGDNGPIRTFAKDKTIDYSKLSEREFLKTFKDNKSKRLAKEIICFCKNSNTKFQDTLTELTSILKKDKCKNGSGVHILLPLAGMSPIGHFYRGYIENHYPNAKISFVLTPESANLKQQKKSTENSFSRYFKKIIDKNNDKLVIMLDYISSDEFTTKRLFRNINSINKNIDFKTIHSPELDKESNLRNYVKWDFGGMTLSEAYRQLVKNEGTLKNRRIAGDVLFNIPSGTAGFLNLSVDPKLNLPSPKEFKKIYFRLKRDEIVKAKTFYYLGKRFNLENAY